MELEIVETACADFFISEPAYAFVDPLCGDSPDYQGLNVSFVFDGEQDCINDVETSSQFFDRNGNELTAIRPESDSLLADGPFVSINGNLVTFHYCYRFENLSDTADLNYIQLNFHTENDVDNESNRIGIRANIPGATINTPTEFEETINVEKNAQFRVWDDAAEDGDIISINVNGTWVIENLMITNAGEFVSLPLNLGSNFVLFYAVNEGSDPPNTLQASFNDGLTTEEFDLSMDLGESKAVRVICR